MLDNPILLCGYAGDYIRCYISEATHYIRAKEDKYGVKFLYAGWLSISVFSRPVMNGVIKLNIIVPSEWGNQLSIHWESPH